MIWHLRHLAFGVNPQYTPFIHEDGRVGYKISWPNGKYSYLYMNPSTSDSENQPNVFIYEGETHEIYQGTPLTYINVRKD